MKEYEEKREHEITLYCHTLFSIWNAIALALFVLSQDKKIITLSQFKFILCCGILRGVECWHNAILFDMINTTYMRHSYIINI